MAADLRPAEATMALSIRCGASCSARRKRTGLHLIWGWKNQNINPQRYAKSRKVPAASC
ncbi:hypothetical protein ZHAS_00012676 [Anopheles sinensis]|uniref:Uncharacterized protein n=1 Tax=Anopheles sinensis TaxID=74873 RepID=A0A084W3G6_ANOSI|nr:hypothetical protein ZHAS_00012676 [Anopheles sinensis]